MKLLVNTSMLGVPSVPCPFCRKLMTALGRSEERAPSGLPVWSLHRCRECAKNWARNWRHGYISEHLPARVDVS